jgi:phosphotransferase system  glucose/maltose/N-acetylglucosamine-specific IIC component
MFAPLIGMAALSALIAALLGWGTARRYGQRRALAVPVLAVAASAVNLWRASGLEPSDAMEKIALAMAFAGPSVAGALLGIALARPRQR